ncbi:endoribonuclease Dcr-1 [Culicoides brevitarsis]|uniref:endoribonuclease Dcr-1 n=1 Tax=Culicoides brevitarsis TaxID=469753 RepID=UPI00307B32AF
MAYFWTDNVHTTAFTPRDYQIELLAASREQNIILCLNQFTEFIAFQLIQEISHELRRKSDNGKHKLVIYLTSNSYAFGLIENLSDLKVFQIHDEPETAEETPEIDFEAIFAENHVIFMSIEKLIDVLVCGFLDLEDVRLLIVDECHKIYGKSQVHELFNEFYTNARQKPSILGLAGALHSADCAPGRLGAEIDWLEKLMRCRAESASDVVTVLRYCQKPTEILLQCAPPEMNEMTECIRNMILCQKSFLMDHRFDPSEIYSDEEYLEELKAIPDPKIQPLEFLDKFLFILDELGPWCADRASFTFLIQLEKQKIKAKFERHYLLLCLVSTTFIQVRSYCQLVFEQISERKSQVELYSTPKVLRLLEILRCFNPEANKKTEKLPEIKVGDKENVESPYKDIHIDHLCHAIDHVGRLIDNISKDLTSLKSKVNDLQSPEAAPKVPQAPATSQNSPVRTVTRARRKAGLGPRTNQRHNAYQNDPDSLCGIIFCDSKHIAKALFSLFCEMSKHDPELTYLNVQYTIDKTADPVLEPKEAETEHRKQEDVLKRFRMHDCNLLIGTSVLEEGIELPKCNLVVRWDPPKTYRSYVQCKGRARAAQAYHIILVAPKIYANSDENSLPEAINPKNHKLICHAGEADESLYVKIDEKIEELTENEPKIDESESKVEEITENSEEKDPEEPKSLELPTECLHKNFIPAIDEAKKSRGLSLMHSATEEMIEKLAEYIEIEKMLLRKCMNTEPSQREFENSEKYLKCVAAYKPPDAETEVFVDLSNAIALVNKYCAKLPSDTFTKLTPLWRCCRLTRGESTLYQYTIRLPINSPLKYDITGPPMPNRVLARKVCALTACKTLHESGELDNNLQPIGKEGFKAFESDWENFELEQEDEAIVNENTEPRPGTTKRRQYYYKRIASAFSDCRPTVGTKTYFYFINMTLTCPIPEEQNTRGRKVYPPEDSPQGFGILTTKRIPKVSAFPIFTRSGEVRVSLQLISTDIILNENQLKIVNMFINYTFTNVLRLQKYLMLFDPEATENCFFIVPTITAKNDKSIHVDWEFLEMIAENINMTPQFVSDEIRKAQSFDANMFKDAVVMPWYRNQDQPQYFYVAEICYHLSPNSSFPGDNYSTFKEYYFKKYGIEIQNQKQPLLDVDHTSARLNFLTPRYVNRKGVALPTSSEETKRAKRENLEQKQILVPELCTIHPFPASLWRAAVCLPCILYRFNALLLADEIRKQVSRDIGLGCQDIEEEDFEWPMLDFGWCLADVLKKSREAKLQAQKLVNGEEKEEIVENSEIKTPEKEEKLENDEEKKENGEDEEPSANELLEEATKKANNELEIGTWSNEMAKNIKNDLEDFDDELDGWGLPSNVSMCTRKNTQIRYGSPTSWEPMGSKMNHNPQNPMGDLYYSDSEMSFRSDDDSDFDNSDDEAENGGLKIEFKSDNVAEAIESEKDILKRQRQLDIIKTINKGQELPQAQFEGFNCMEAFDNDESMQMVERKIKWHETEFERCKEESKTEILSSKMLVKSHEKLIIKRKSGKSDAITPENEENVNLMDLVPYMEEREVAEILGCSLEQVQKLTIDQLFALNEAYLARVTLEKAEIVGVGDIFDRFNDRALYDGQKMLVIRYPDVRCRPISEDLTKVDFHKTDEIYRELEKTGNFSFDYQPDLETHPGPSPSIILQALTMSNANDGINLERLETIGDSFLKYAITTYLYLTYENVHEGKLSHLRSKQVSNLNLYRLGRRKILGESMIATKFEPHDNWLPPCYYVPKELEQALIAAKIPACHWNLADLPNIKQLPSEEICRLVKERAEEMGLLDDDDESDESLPPDEEENVDPEDFPCFIPYNLVTQHSIPDKSIADCVEALIGAYLIECGPKGALLFMAWLGIRVLPMRKSLENVKKTRKFEEMYDDWKIPRSPLLHFSPHVDESLDCLLDGYEKFEEAIGYKFRDRSYLLQAMTHASFSPNRLTDCYQRLEFLGDAVLDYLITRHLYEDPRQHSPGALTDLRSALVNNSIFASLAVRHGFHKYFRHLSPGLNDVIDRFVRIQNENGHCISEEFYLLSEDECDEAEDVEVPKALGDVFESVAGAIFLDSFMSLDSVWKVYSSMMNPEIEQFSNSVPKSPIRELLELEPETAKFGKPEKLADGRRVRVTVEVFGKGTYRGIGRNYRIAKCTAAKCALRQLKKQGLINRKH